MELEDRSEGINQMKAPIPENESERLAALRELEVLDTDAEKVFDDVTRLATYIWSLKSSQCREQVRKVTPATEYSANAAHV